MNTTSVATSSLQEGRWWCPVRKGHCGSVWRDHRGGFGHCWSVSPVQISACHRRLISSRHDLPWCCHGSGHEASQCGATLESMTGPEHPRRFRSFLDPPTLPADSKTGPIRPGLILLINPFYAKDPCGSFGKHALTPSLALTSLAASTPQGFEVRIWDENLLQGEVPVDPLPEVVGITVHLTFARRAYLLADWFHKRGSKVILGGLHVTACPDEAAAHADAIVIGEGVSVWPRVLDDLRSKQLTKRYVGSFREPLYEDLPSPRRDLMPKGSFLTTSSLIATRGCHNRCSFCYLSLHGLRMPFQRRTIRQVVQDIRQSNEPYSVFIDNNLGSDRDYLRDLCRAFRPLGHIWSAAVSLDVTDDRGLVEEMARAGCTGVFVGFETLSASNLSEANKKGPSPIEFPWRIRLLQDHGIQVNGSFVLGFDHDGPEVFNHLLDWIERHKLECATLQILTPYPGTPLYAKLAAEGRILHHDWDLYDTAHAVFMPKLMAPGELEAGYARCYRRLFSYRSILRRRPRAWRAVPAYLAMTLLYKKSNRLWSVLIKRRLVSAAWRPLVEISRRRHLRWRARFDVSTNPGEAQHEAAVRGA